MSSMMEIDNEDEATRAYASISKQLQSWTSPQASLMVGTPVVEYSQDSVQWIKQYTKEGDGITPAKRSSGEATPVMSNSAKKQALSPVDDDDIMSMSSPWIDASLPTHASSEAHEYRRYHHVLYTYLAARRSLAERVRLTEEESAMVPRHDGASTDDVIFASEERRIELEYLSSLALLDDVLEGNFWSLLATLRALGTDALLWNPPLRNEIPAYLSKLASRKAATPGQLLHDLWSANDSPLILQRRKSLLEWMERCQEQDLDSVELPRKSKMWPNTLEKLRQGCTDPTKVSCLDPDAPLLVKDPSSSPFYSKDGENEDIMVKACLTYIRAGRMDLAMNLCQRQGQPWRCASWSGGEPYDVQLVASSGPQVVPIKVGNPRRGLWKRTCWELARSTKVSTAEAAIYAILSSNVQAALKNPSLRSWEGGMYACWSSMLGRCEDEVLQRHKPSAQQFEQLQATAAIASWNEAAIMDTLTASPFEEMRPNDALRGAMASFLVGKIAVLNYVLKEGADVKSHTIEHLRFLSHLLLYLDSLSASTVATTMPGAEQVKNQVVLEYLRQLGLRPDLWHMLALYASLLPSETMIQEYPLILVKIQDDEERASMCKQMQELFAPGITLVVLRRVVRLELQASQDPQRPMRSITWLCHADAHLADALVCTNMLLRKFLLAQDDQVAMALLFLDEYLPELVAEYAKSADAPPSQGDEEMEDSPRTNLIEDCKREFGALQCYLEAYRAFLTWKEVMDNTPSTTKGTSVVSNWAALNPMERDIADSAKRRELVQQKRKASRAVVEAADAARSKLFEVLTYPGGWLLEEDSIRQGSDEEMKERRQDLEEVQARYLPRTVFFLHTVCNDTATWMADSLADASKVFGQTALLTLDNASDLALSPLSPLYWIGHAMALVETVAEEEHGICDTFSDKDAKILASLMAESAVRELQYKAL